jgi:hypothetical protein
MIPPGNWLARAWNFDLEAVAFPNVLERVRGTPARAAALTRGFPEAVLGLRDGPKWSAKEHIAHLDDLHELDMRRAEEFLRGADKLTAADMTNSRTEAARHNETSLSGILERLARHRDELVARLEPLSEAEVLSSSLHPRLKRKIRLVDWLYFVAEHDDHHLVRARLAIASVSPR